MKQIKLNDNDDIITALKITRKFETLAEHYDQRASHLATGTERQQALSRIFAQVAKDIRALIGGIR